MFDTEIAKYAIGEKKYFREEELLLQLWPEISQMEEIPIGDVEDFVFDLLVLR
jgi:hypothetical protein